MVGPAREVGGVLRAAKGTSGGMNKEEYQQKDTQGAAAGKVQ